MTRILYDNNDVFLGLAPTPLFSRTAEMIRFGERWGQKHQITLRGQLTGKCLQYEDYLARQQLLLNGFRYDFKRLEIQDNAVEVTGYAFVQVEQISFESSTYAQGFIPFEITLSAYPEEYFSGQYGIIDPVDAIEFSEEEDGTFSITHTTSAKGFCTSAGTSDALENARSWVAARTGWSSQVLPSFISGIGNGVCLQELSEKTDRLNATYQVIERYLGDEFGPINNGLLRYSTDFNSGIEDGISTMSVEGQIKGCRYQDLSSLRDRYAGFNAFSQAINEFYRITSRTDLNPNPVSKSVSEDSTNRVIGFSYVYDDDLRPKVNVIYSIDFEYDFESDGVSSSISATVSSKGVYNSSKWDEVQSLANSINLYTVIVPHYNAYVNVVAPHLANFPLNPKPISTTRSDNEFAATVSLGATYGNAPIPPPGLDGYDVSISLNPSLHKYSAQPILDGNGEYYIFDLGFRSRGNVQIQTDGIGSDSTSPESTLQILKNQTQFTQAAYFAGSRMVLDSQSYTTGNAAFNKRASVSASYSAEQPEFSL